MIKNYKIMTWKEVKKIVTSTRITLYDGTREGYEVYRYDGDIVYGIDEHTWKKSLESRKFEMEMDGMGDVIYVFGYHIPKVFVVEDDILTDEDFEL